MREFCEFRIVEEFAPLLFKDEGEILGGTVRKVKISTDDPRFQLVGKLQREINSTKRRSFFHGWDLKRYYTESELAIAECFLCILTATFEPSAEECGTRFDESTACPKCGSGATQLNDLHLDWKRIPKRADIARTIADEIVVSKKLVDIFTENKVTGVKYRPVRRKAKSSEESKDWFQLVVESSEVEIATQTKVGINPFNDDTAGEYRCPLGDSIGLNLLSEAFVKKVTFKTLDIASTR